MRDSKHISRRVLVTAVLAAALAGCQGEPLRVVGHTWPGYELLFLAAREGWVSPRHAALVETRSASESIEALRGGSADAALLTLDEVLRIREEGVAVTIVLVVDVSAGADVVLARSPARRVADLAGKRIGVERSALGAFMLHQALRAGGLGLGDVLLVDVPVDRHAEAWLAGRVDAIVTYEPYATPIEASGAVRVFDSRAIPGAVVDVLAVRPEALQRRAASVRAVVRAHFTARRHLQENPQDASYRMSRHLRLEPSGVLEAYRGLDLPGVAANRRLLGGSAPTLRRSVDALAKVMTEAGLLRGDSEMEDLLLPDFVPVEEP